MDHQGNNSIPSSNTQDGDGTEETLSDFMERIRKENDEMTSSFDHAYSALANALEEVMNTPSTSSVAYAAEENGFPSGSFITRTAMSNNNGRASNETTLVRDAEDPNANSTIRAEAFSPQESAKFGRGTYMGNYVSYPGPGTSTVKASQRYDQAVQATDFAETSIKDEDNELESDEQTGANSTEGQAFKKASELCEELLTTIASYTNKIAQIRAEHCNYSNSSDISEAFSRICNQASANTSGFSAEFSRILNGTSTSFPNASGDHIASTSGATSGRSGTVTINNADNENLADDDWQDDYNEWYAHTNFRNFTQGQGRLDLHSDSDEDLNSNSPFSLRRVEGYTNLRSSQPLDPPTRLRDLSPETSAFYRSIGMSFLDERDSTQDPFKDFILMPENPKHMENIPESEIPLPLFQLQSNHHGGDNSGRMVDKVSKEKCKPSLQVEQKIQNFQEELSCEGVKSNEINKRSEKNISDLNLGESEKLKRPLKRYECHYNYDKMPAIPNERIVEKEEKMELETVIENNEANITRKHSGLHLICDRLSSFMKTCSVMKKSPSDLREIKNESVSGKNCLAMDQLMKDNGDAKEGNGAA